VQTLSRKIAVHIPPKWTTPPALEGYSVVYVIHVRNGFYVGETDSLAQRIRQHRSRSGWSDGTTIAVRVEGGKTNARNLESRLIRKFASAGLPLLSVVDGQRIRPRNRTQENDEDGAVVDTRGGDGMQDDMDIFMDDGDDTNSMDLDDANSDRNCSSVAAANST